MLIEGFENALITTVRLNNSMVLKKRFLLSKKIIKGKENSKSFTFSYLEIK